MYNLNVSESFAVKVEADSLCTELVILATIFLLNVLQTQDGDYRRLNEGVSAYALLKLDRPIDLISMQLYFDELLSTDEDKHLRTCQGKLNQFIHEHHYVLSVAFILLAD